VVESGSEILLKLKFSATLCFDPTDKSHIDVAIAVDLNSPGWMIHLIDRDFEQIAWAKEIGLWALSLNADWLRFSSCGLLRLRASKHAARYYDR